MGGFPHPSLSSPSSHSHIWCHAHLLNLVPADTTGSVVESASLISLLNDIAVFPKIVIQAHAEVG